MEVNNKNTFLVMLNIDMMLWTRISNIDLQIIENDLTRTLGWSHSKCEDIISEYKKFLYLCITNTDKTKSLIPSKDVDEVWHAHILRTEKYVSDCHIVGKQYIHHFPTPSDAPPANPTEFENGTKYLYEKVFGTLPQSWRGISRTAKVAECTDACRCGTVEYQGEKLADCTYDCRCQGEKLENLANCGTCSYCGNCQNCQYDNAQGDCRSCECQTDDNAQGDCRSCECQTDDNVQCNKLATADFKNWKSLNLGEIKFRLIRKHGWTEKRTNDGIEDYKKFLKKVVDTSSNLVEHSEDVEKIWENHLLYTQQYKTDCDAINPAGYIHHVPMVY